MEFLVVVVIASMQFCMTTSAHQGPDCNIRQYSYYTNLAEMAITHSDYSKALVYYDSAADFIHSPFATDRYNTSVCNAILGNYNTCRTEVLSLFGKGLSKEVIRNNKAFAGFLTSEYGKGILEQKVEPTYNVSLRKLYDSIYAVDQMSVRKHIAMGTDDYDDVLFKMDVSNIKALNKLIATYGWPTEDLLGINELGFQQYETIIINQKHSKHQVYNFTDDIRNAHQQGLIESHKALFLISMANGTDEANNSEAGQVTIVYDSLGVYHAGNLSAFKHKTGFYPLKENRASIEMQRQQYGVEPIDDFRAKVLLSLKDDRFCFRYDGAKTTYAICYLSEYEYAAKRLIGI